MHDERYNANDVIHRGYNIYDEWTNGKLSSRKIVSYVERAVATLKSQKTKSAYREALSCLFALDLRVKEKYNSTLKCLLHYFSWRRETRTLKKTKLTFKFSEGTDIYTELEIKLALLHESLVEELIDDDANNSGGGKRNKFNQENSAQAENAQGEQSLNNANEQGSDVNEAEQSMLDEKINNAEKAEESSLETSTEEIQEVDQPTKEANTTKKAPSENKTESTASEANSETITDTQKSQTYNYAIDAVPPPYWDSSSSKRHSDDNKNFYDSPNFEINEKNVDEFSKKSQEKSNENQIDSNQDKEKSEQNSNDRNERDRDNNNRERKNNQNIENAQNGKQTQEHDGENEKENKSEIKDEQKDTDKKSYKDQPSKDPLEGKINKEIKFDTPQSDSPTDLTPNDVAEIHDKLIAAAREHISVDGADFDYTSFEGAKNQIINSKIESKTVNITERK